MDHVIAVFHVIGVIELFNDIRPGGRGAETAADVFLHTFIGNVFGRIFHHRQQTRFGIAGRRFGFIGFDHGIFADKGIAFFQLRQILEFPFLFFRIVDETPAFIGFRLTACLEDFSVPIQRYRNIPIAVFRVEYRQKTLDRHEINLLFIIGHFQQIGLFLSGNNGVMIGNFGVVDTAFFDGTAAPQNVPHLTAEFAESHGFEPLTQCGHDIIGQITGIGAGICQHFMGLVELLHQIQCLFGGEMILFVGVLLQFRQIVKHRRRNLLFRGFHFGYRKSTVEHPPFFIFRRFQIGDGAAALAVIPGGGKGTEIGF